MFRLVGGYRKEVSFLNPTMPTTADDIVDWSDNQTPRAMKQALGQPLLWTGNPHWERLFDESLQPPPLTPKE